MVEVTTDKKLFRGDVYKGAGITGEVVKRLPENRSMYVYMVKVK